MRKSVIYSLLIIGVMHFSACTSDKQEGVVISDQTLFELAINLSGYKFYKNNPDTLAVAGGSPHGSFIRVRFNDAALDAMDAGISTLPGGTFPDGAVVVKEISDSRGGPVNVLAIIYKSSAAANAGAGWLWNEVRPDGSVIFSVARKGDGCIGCHSASGNIDLVRTFSLH